MYCEPNSTNTIYDPKKVKITKYNFFIFLSSVLKCNT